MGFNVGDRVLSIRFGFGKVTHVDMECGYPIEVDFDCKKQESYTIEGKVWAEDHFRSLYPANSGVVTFDTTELPKLEVDQPVWVRQDVTEKWFKGHFRSFEGPRLSIFAHGKTSHSTEFRSCHQTFSEYRTTDPALEVKTDAE